MVVVFDQALEDADARLKQRQVLVRRAAHALVGDRVAQGLLVQREEVLVGRAECDRFAMYQRRPCSVSRSIGDRHASCVTATTPNRFCRTAMMPSTEKEPPSCSYAVSMPPLSNSAILCR